MNTDLAVLQKLDYTAYCCIDVDWMEVCDKPAQEVPVVTVLIEHCACCWYLAHPNQCYPALWSSTLCQPHAEWTRNRRRISRKPGDHHAKHNRWQSQDDYS